MTLNNVVTADPCYLCSKIWLCKSDHKSQCALHSYLHTRLTASVREWYQLYYGSYSMAGQAAKPKYCFVSAG